MQRDWTVAWQGRWFQIEAGHEALCLVGRKVIVRELRNGTVQLIREKQKLKYRELAARLAPAPRFKVLRQAAPQTKPAAKHPWRQFGSAVGQEFWRGVKARAQAARQPSRDLRSASATLRPPSGPARAGKKKLQSKRTEKGDISS